MLKITKQQQMQEYALNLRKGMNEDAVLEKAGFEIVYGTNKCKFNGVLFDRDLALDLALNKI